MPTEKMLPGKMPRDRKMLIGQDEKKSIREIN